MACLALCAKRLERQQDSSQISLMGILGAFVFAAQMINIAIPGTGASGHLGGGVLLAILLGPSAAFVVISSILFVQALFFADGGLLALGCNMINMGIIPTLIAYPLIYQRLAPSLEAEPFNRYTGWRHRLVILVTTVVALQLGSLGVIIQTTLSDISAISSQLFLLLMQPIHLVIGLGEGVITLFILSFLAKTQPQLLQQLAPPAEKSQRKHPIMLLTLITLFVGGLFSSFASENPDGLEWSIAQAKNSTAQLTTAQPSRWHQQLATLQQQTTLLADYQFSDTENRHDTVIDAGNATAGLVGGAVCTLVISIIVWISRRSGRRRDATAISRSGGHGSQ